MANRLLELTDVESELRKLLLEVANYINPTKPSELRYTGGWVRDKLLGIPSHDIDVSINDMTGYQFGLRMQEYLQTTGTSTQYGIKDVIDTDDATANCRARTLKHGLHKIEANPEKSKHLETVTTNIFGLDVDLVNLRKETYTEESRNPQMEFGTAAEDALRRDATINAMFYNLQTQVVEDFTGKGFHDIDNKIIRTPLEPYQTFKDDPLRVLRLIRFASKLGYSIDPPAEEAMKFKDIKDALKAKISRERVGVELDKMLKGPNPHVALSTINRLGIYTTIFVDPTADHGYQPETRGWNLAYECAAQILGGDTADEKLIRKFLIQNSEQEYLAWLLSAFIPYADAPMLSTGIKGAKSTHPVATWIAREGIKATNKICDLVTASVRNMDEIISIKDNFIRSRRMSKMPADRENSGRRDSLGMAIRRWGVSWRSQVMYAIMLESSKRIQGDVLGAYAAFLEHIDKLGLQMANDFKPVVDGKELAKALDAKPGPWMKDALDVVMAWQLRNQDSATKEGAIAAVRERQGELTANLIQHFLQLTVRPLFQKTQMSDVTAEGRRVTASPGLPRKHEGIEDEAVTRPWKADSNAYVLSLLSWCIKCLDEKRAEQNWALLIPPILTLVDDADAKYKTLGCRLLAELLDRTSPALLARSGLGQVFEEALRPCFSYLPTLTPEVESIQLLDAVYPAALVLARVRHTLDTRSSDSVARHRSVPQQLPQEMVTALTHLLHNHLLTSIQHVTDSHPRIVTALINHMTSIVEIMGINIVAELVYIIPVLNSQLTMPFSTAYPPLPLAAAKSLQAVLANAWPRVYMWRTEMMYAICKCWICISEDDQRSASHSIQEDIEEVKKQLQVCAEMLTRAVEARTGEDGPFQIESIATQPLPVDIKTEIRSLLDANRSLKGLLQELIS